MRVRAWTSASVEVRIMNAALINVWTSVHDREEGERLY